MIKYVKPLDTFVGIPARDMTEEEWKALPVPDEVKTAALSLGIYEIVEEE